MTAPATSSNLDQITNFLLGKGLTREQVAGIAGNLKIESGYNPSAYNANEGAIGIAQWEGGRRQRLQAYAAQSGGKETDLNVQLGFLWNELTGSQIGALNQIAVTTTPAAAAAAFDQYYERSSGSSRTARISAANNVYTGVGPGAGDPGFTTSGGGAAFRAQGGAFTTSPGAATGGSGNVNVPWWTALFPGIPGVYAGFQKAGVSDPVAAVTGTVMSFAMKALFIAAGVGLVIVGLAKTVEPAVSKAANVASNLKPF